MSLIETADVPAPEEQTLSRIIPLKDISPKARQQIELAVKQLSERNNATIKIDGDRLAINATTNQMFLTLDRTFNELLEIVNSGKDLSISKIQTSFRTNQTAVQRQFDPKAIAREAARSAQREARAKEEAERNKQPEPITHYLQFADEEDEGKLAKLSRHLSRAPKSREAMSEFKDFGGTEILLDERRIKVFFPVYEDDAATNSAKEVVLAALTNLENSLEGLPSRHFTKAFVSRTIENAKKKPKQPSAAAAKETTGGNTKVVAAETFIITELAGKSAAQWAHEVDKSGRIANLRAFKENKDLDFEVTVARKGGETIGFKVKLAPTSLLDTGKIKIIHFVLEEVQKKWRKAPNSTKAAVSEWLKEIWADIDHSSEIDHGDHLKLTFEKTARLTPENLALNASFSDATRTIPKGDISPKINFELPAFSRDGVLHFRRESGRTEELTPTSNQAKLMNAIRNPSFDTIVCQGPTGAGKTLWVCYAALELLKQGHVFKILYDRPLEGAGGKSIGYLKGDLEEKMGPFHGPFEKAFAKILGKGNIAAGQAVFKDLRDNGIIERYDEIFKRGDTVEDALLIIDEAQNKTRDEIFHLITRPDANSKALLMGDGEFQVDLKNKSSSGLIEAGEIYGRIASFAFIQLDENDIKRKDTVREIYLARRDFEIAEKAGRETRQQPRLSIPDNLPPATVTAAPKGP